MAREAFDDLLGQDANDEEEDRKEPAMVVLLRTFPPQGDAAVFADPDGVAGTAGAGASEQDVEGVEVAASPPPPRRLLPTAAHPYPYASVLTLTDLRNIMQQLGGGSGSHEQPKLVVVGGGAGGGGNDDSSSGGGGSGQEAKARAAAAMVVSAPAQLVGGLKSWVDKQR
jgi:hypothetical protein